MQKTNSNLIQTGIVVQRLFSVSTATIWKAISDKDEMKKWYFDLPEFNAEVGFAFSFLGGEDPENQYVHLCEITAVIPEKLLTYSWKYDGYGGISFVSFELVSHGKETTLKLTHKGIETFTGENPDLAIENFLEGWEYIINIALKEYLEGL